MEPKTGQKRPLYSIQAGRGLAAVLVVLHHAGNIAAEDRFYGTTTFHGLLRGFSVGVDYFFVLSGFIIAWIHWSDLGQPGRLPNYARRRFLRIYPPYWGILIPLMALYIAVPSAGQPFQHDPVNYVVSPVLFPYRFQPILGVAWTLVFEVIFYVFFGALIYFGRKALWAVPIWAILIVLAQTAEPLAYPFNIFLSPLILEFFMGAAVSVFLQHRSLARAPLWGCVGLACFIAALFFSVQIQQSQLGGRLVFGLSSVAALAGFVEWERRGGIAVPRWLQALGNASYAIYLIHTVAISFAIQAMIKVAGTRLPLPAAIICLTAVGIAAGFAYHVLAENRLIDLCRRVLFGPRRPTETPNLVR